MTDFREVFYQMEREKSLLRDSDEFDWVDYKFDYLSLPLRDKRRLYRCGENFKTLEDVITWGYNSVLAPRGEQEPQSEPEDAHEPKKPAFPRNLFEADHSLNIKIGIFSGKIHTLEVDAIVNFCGPDFLSFMAEEPPSPPVNYLYYDYIHKAAGQYLREECDSIVSCPVGEAKITGGYLLPAKYVIHTAVPTEESLDDIQKCYMKSLCLAVENNIKTIAFPCISSAGIYGYPNKKVAESVLVMIRKFLQVHHRHIELIVFCVLEVEDVDLYRELLPRYFPL